MAPTPSSTSKIPQTFRTPLSKHRLNFNSSRTPSQTPYPNQPFKEAQQIEHPIEVIGRMRDYSEKKEKPTSILRVNPDNQTLRVHADFGYRDFTLDGISFSEEEDLDAFYKKFVESRINGVKLGAKCTIMMYGPTGSGKSHTMFGSAKQAGIVYRSLKDILGEGESESEGSATFVQVTVLEIYNEEIYDLLSSGSGGFGIGWPKGGNASKVKLEVMGKKAKNASFISGTEAGKISREIQKVEKRRIVKSTLCNDRSSRSHCIIILDVPTVGGRLMLVDMAGSENIDQAGQVGFEAKMQTAKINQGNIALKRVVESIANGDSHVPFRDSKLTMLLQDSFEDDKSKILMILCASPDPKEIHKTICTLEYGAKAKCIVRVPHIPSKDKVEDSSAVILGSRIAAMDQFIYKLQEESKLREKERNEAHKQLMKKEEEIAALRTLIEGKGPAASEEEINLMVNERTNMLKTELEGKLEECRRMAEEFVEMERRRMEERIVQQQQEVEMLRRRLEEIEFELSRSKDEATNDLGDMDGSNFARRLLGVYTDEEPGMVKSMDLDMGDQDVIIRVDTGANNRIQNFSAYPDFCDKACLSTVYEEEEVEDEEDQKEKVEDDMVGKEVEEIKKVVAVSTPVVNPLRDVSDVVNLLSGPANEFENLKDAATSRRMRIQNIFTLCGNNRELSQQLSTTLTPAKKSEDIDSIDSYLSSVTDSVRKDSEIRSLNKENTPPVLKNAAMIDTSKDLSDLIEAPHLSSTPFITRRRR